jgi:dipeptide/tripeptide permease
LEEQPENINAKRQGIKKRDIKNFCKNKQRQTNRIWLYLKGRITMLTKADIEKYFIAEKHESLVFLVIGVAVIVLALIFYFTAKTQIYRGAALPLLILGLMQAVAGYTVLIRSDDQRISQVYAYDMNPDQLKTIELTRMRKVKTNFLIYRWIEIGAFITGLILIILFSKLPLKAYWLGFGITFTIMAAELFIADFIAEKRADHYTSLLEEYNKKA